MSENANSVEKRIVTGLLAALSVTDAGVAKTDSFDPDTEPDGSGAVTVEIAKLEQVFPGLPEWYLSISVVGLSFASVDPDKAIIRRLFGDVLRSVRSWTAAGLSESLGIAVLGIRPVTNAALRGGPDRFLFTVDFQLVATIPEL